MRKLLYIISAVALSVTMSGCADWLNPDQGNKILEKDAYATELGINNILNGLYRTLVSEDLYGGKLTAGTVDFFANYYDYPTKSRLADMEELTGLSVLGSLGNPTNFAWVQNKEYQKDFLDPIWTSGYKLILGINTFIDNLEENTVLSENRRRLYLGEAYGLLAMVHLDLYRLYGPLDLTKDKAMPFHGNAAIEKPGYLSGTAYLGKVMETLNKADEYLATSDPIKLDNKVWDGANDDTDMLTVDRFAKMFRNKRMNYWAVQVLKMRVNVILNTPASRQAVITAAETFFNEAVDPNYNSIDSKPMKAKAKAFAWTPLVSTASYYGMNPVLYDEVIMGPSDINMAKWFTDHMLLIKPSKQSRVVMRPNLITNIFAGTATSDKRNGMFYVGGLQKDAISNAGQDYYLSRRYSGSYVSGENVKGNLSYNIKDMRVLIRMSEVMYLKVEALLNDGQLTPAIEALNTVLTYRGYDPNTSDTYSAANRLPVSAKTEDVRDMLTREYYREFVYEGQAFFFVKRMAALSGAQEYPIFRGNLNTAVSETADPTMNLTRAQFVLPRPESETDAYPETTDDK